MEVKNLSFSYGERQVLKDVSFSAEYGQILSVLGPNGVGKSTLFRCMLGLMKPQNGEVLMDGTSVQAMNARELSRRVAYIPQSHNPVFNYSVLDMVLMGTTAQMGGFSSPGRVQVDQAKETLERLGIGELAGRGYGNLSGGERQLVLIARAMVQNAKIMIMDEPSSSLDYGNRHRVMETVRELGRDGYGIVQSTHDPDQAYLYSDKILALYDGKVLAFGTPEETIQNEVISKLYGVDVEVCSLREDSVRVCIPKYKNPNEVF